MAHGTDSSYRRGRRVLRLWVVLASLAASLGRPLRCFACSWRFGIVASAQRRRELFLRAGPRSACSDARLAGSVRISAGKASTSASPSVAMRAREALSYTEALGALGLPAGTSQSEVKNRFRQLVATEHPDKNPGDPQAGAKFAEIVAAYQRLREPPNPSESIASGAGADAGLNDDELAEEIREVLEATKGTSDTVRAVATVIVTLALLTQPLGIWAKNEIGTTCTTGAVDRQWCEQLVQLRCVGEFAFGDVQVCVRDGRSLIDANSLIEANGLDRDDFIFDSRPRLG